MEKEATENAEAQIPKEKIFQTLDKILADEPLTEDDKQYIERVKEIMNY